MLEGVLHVSEYTDKVEAPALAKNAGKRKQAIMRELHSILSALLLACDYEVWRREEGRGGEGGRHGRGAREGVHGRGHPMRCAAATAARPAGAPHSPWGSRARLPYALTLPSVPG